MCTLDQCDRKVILKHVHGVPPHAFDPIYRPIPSTKKIPPSRATGIGVAGRKGTQTLPRSWGPVTSLSRRTCRDPRGSEVVVMNARARLQGRCAEHELKSREPHEFRLASESGNECSDLLKTALSSRSSVVEIDDGVRFANR